MVAESGWRKQIVESEGSRHSEAKQRRGGFGDGPAASATDKELVVGFCSGETGAPWARDLGVGLRL